MATVKTIKDDIRAKVKVADLNTFLAKDFVKENKALLRGQTTGSYKDIYSNINDYQVSQFDEVFAVAQAKINDLIPDTLVNFAHEFTTLQTLKKQIEKEINDLEYAKNSVDGRESMAGQMKVMEIELEIDSKQQELDTIKRSYFETYRTGVETTQISSELSEMVNEIQNVRNEYFEEIDKEIELLQVKANMLGILRSRMNIVENVKDMIDARLGTLDSDKVIKSSEMNIPFIQTLVK